MDKQNKEKILGNISDGTHQKIFAIKNTHRLKSVEETLKFLLDIYKKDIIRQDLEREEHINNSNINEIESVIKPQNNI